MDNNTGRIFDTQRFSIHDGPGIRTTVFFKGCSLKCIWCQNPESIKYSKEIAFYKERCIICGLCSSACEKNAIIKGTDKRILRDKCNLCGGCASVCPANALRLIGTDVTADELLLLCISDIDFFHTSGGGISLSGGEPVLQWKFLKSFLPLIKKKNINVLLETAGNYDYTCIEGLLDFIDTIYFDYKLSGEDEYLKYTGTGSNKIDINLKKLTGHFKDITVRVPIIPGINTGEDKIIKLSNKLASFGIDTIHILKYNMLWESKIERLDTDRKILSIDDKNIDYDKIIGIFHDNSINTILDI